MAHKIFPTNYKKIEFNFAELTELLSPLKIPIVSAVRGSLPPPLKISTKSAVHGSLLSFFLKVRPIWLSLDPCIPVYNSDRFDRP